MFQFPLDCADTIFTWNVVDLYIEIVAASEHSFEESNSFPIAKIFFFLQ